MAKVIDMQEYLIGNESQVNFLKYADNKYFSQPLMEGLTLRYPEKFNGKRLWVSVELSFETLDYIHGIIHRALNPIIEAIDKKINNTANDTRESKKDMLRGKLSLEGLHEVEYQNKRTIEVYENLREFILDLFGGPKMNYDIFTKMSLFDETGRELSKASLYLIKVIQFISFKELEYIDTKLFNKRNPKVVAVDIANGEALDYVTGVEIARKSIFKY